MSSADQSSQVSANFGCINSGIVTAGTISASAISVGTMSLTKGNVTQLTSSVTPVTVTAKSGLITCFTSSLPALNDVSFNVIAPCVTSNVIFCSLNIYSGTGNPFVKVTAVTAGQFTITMSNVSDTVAMNAVPSIAYIIL